MGLKELQELRENRGKPKEKKFYRIPKKSSKKLAQEGKEKENRNGDDTLLQNWHKARRKECTGFCMCGCGEPSQSEDNQYYRHSNCHIFPKKLFPSIMYNRYNHVERAFWGGCHSNMDEQSMDKWVGFADWQDIREKFFILSTMLTDDERKTKFYGQLEKLVYG